MSNRSDEPSPTLLVWDHEETPPVGKWTLVLWRKFGIAGGETWYSIPKRVEDHAEILRTRYLAWIHDLGNARIQGECLLDYFAIRPGFSYWWMTLPAAVSFGGPTSIYLAMRMLALEGLAGELSAGKIILSSGNKVLARAIRLWCRNARLEFGWRRRGDTSPNVPLLKMIYRSLPHPFQGMAFLLHYLKDRWPLRSADSGIECTESGKKITFVDYLINLEPKNLEAGRFRSNYWTGLHDVLKEAGARVTWFHHYLEHEAVPNSRHARELIGRFNKPDDSGGQTHSTLDDALGWNVLKGIFRDYCRIAWLAFRLRGIRQHFMPEGSKIDFWPLFVLDWRRLFYGASAVSNCIFLNVFEKILLRLPHQELGIYLMENQPWEMAFLHAWRTAGHGHLVGVPHSTVLYWDLRYFFDKRTYERKGANELPLPDQVALNGPVVIDTFSAGGFPEEKIVAVEALRYQFLTKLDLGRRGARRPTIGPLSVLVLSDFFPLITLQQLQWLEAAALALPPDTRYVVKPHPSCGVTASDFPSLQLKITGAPLAELFGECDVAYTGNLTSAAVDAYCARIPVVSILDGAAFNMSPLRGLAGVCYVTNPHELAFALQNVRNTPDFETRDYFHLDEKLPRWRRLLELGQFNAA